MSLQRQRGVLKPTGLKTAVSAHQTCGEAMPHFSFALPPARQQVILNPADHLSPQKKRLMGQLTLLIVI